MEMIDSIKVTVKDDDVISTKDRIKYAIIGLIWFLAIPLAKLSKILKPLYKKVYYGQANSYFEYGIGIALMIAFFFIIKYAIVKRMNVTYKKDVKPLSWLKFCILFFGIFFVIFVISAAFGFNLKPIHDIGNNMPAFMIGQFFVKLAYQAFGMIFAIFMIENFQYALDDLIHVNNETLKKYIPYGAIPTMLTYGIYALCTHVGASLFVLYFFYIIVYNIIYLACDRSILKTIGFSLLLFLL